MTPNELYARAHTHEAPLSVLAGFYYNFVKEANIEDAYIDLENVSTNRVVIKVLKDFDFDHRRFWRLATVWFDEKPVMIIQNAGREGDDHARRFITNPVLFAEMCEHLYQVCVKAVSSDEQSIQNDLIEEDKDDGQLTSFYSNQLDGYFSRF